MSFRLFLIFWRLRRVMALTSMLPSSVFSLIQNLSGRWMAPSYQMVAFGVLAATSIGWLCNRRRNRYVDSSKKAVLVTGCDSGIGHEMALYLDQLGFRVFAGCLIPDGPGAKSLQESASISLKVVELDVTSDEKVEQALKKVKDLLPQDEKLWAVVNNAGLCILGLFEWYTWPQINQLVNINLLGSIRVLKTFLPMLKEAQGRVVTISSIVAQMPIPGSAVYNATKYALEGLSDSLRRELSTEGVKVVVVEPGDHSKQTNITKRQREYAAEQWEAMEEEEKTKIEPMFNAFHDSIVVSRGRSRVKTKEEAFSVILSHIKEAVQATNPNTRYLSSPFGERLFVKMLKFLPIAWQDSIVTSVVRRSWRLKV